MLLRGTSTPTPRTKWSERVGVSSGPKHTDTHLLSTDIYTTTNGNMPADRITGSRRCCSARFNEHDAPI